MFCLLVLRVRIVEMDKYIVKYKNTSTDNNRGGDGDIESTACSSKSDAPSAACDRGIPVISGNSTKNDTGTERGSRRGRTFKKHWVKAYKSYMDSV